MLYFIIIFITLLYISPKEEPPSFCNECYLNDFPYLVPLHDNDQNSLDVEWITPDELENRECVRICTAQIFNYIRILIFLQPIYQLQLIPTLIFCFLIPLLLLLLLPVLIPIW